MLVKVDKLIFLVYFVVLEIEENMEVSIILGRPFLATSQTLCEEQEVDIESRR